MGRVVVIECEKAVERDNPVGIGMQVFQQRASLLLNAHLKHRTGIVAFIDKIALRIQHALMQI